MPILEVPLQRDLPTLLASQTLPVETGVGFGCTGVVSPSTGEGVATACVVWVDVERVEELRGVAPGAKTCPVGVEVGTAGELTAGELTAGPTGPEPLGHVPTGGPVGPDPCFWTIMPGVGKARATDSFVAH